MLFGNVTCFSVNKENKFANDTNLCNYFSYSHLHIIITFYFLTVFFFERLLFIYFHHTVKFLGGKVIHYPLSLLTIKLNNESGYFLPSRLFFLPYEIIKAVRLDAIERLTLNRM